MMYWNWPIFWIVFSAFLALLISAFLQYHFANRSIEKLSRRWWPGEADGVARAAAAKAMRRALFWDADRIQLVVVILTLAPGIVFAVEFPAAIANDLKAGIVTVLALIGLMFALLPPLSAKKATDKPPTKEHPVSALSLTTGAVLVALMVVGPLLVPVSIAP